MQKTIGYITLSLLATLIKVTSCFSQTQASEAKFRLLTYGPPDFERQNSQYVVAQKWGIEFYPVAGCVVTQEFEDSIERHNKKVERLIKKQYGKNWETKFYKEVDAEFETEQNVTFLISQLDYITKRQAEMEKAGKGLHYIMTPVGNTTKYNVSVQGWGKWNGKVEWVTYYKILVDYKTKSAELLSENIMKE